jgi:hypothetical protein
VRRGEHPRGEVHRLDLLDDDALDRLRARFPTASTEAMDGAEMLDAAVDASLVARGLDSRALGALPKRPILTVFVCLSCGSTTAARAEREWAVDRAMRLTGLGEREVAAVVRLLAEAFGAAAPAVDRLDAVGVLELAGLVGHDVDLVSLRSRVRDLVEGASKARALAGTSAESANRG